MTTDYRFLVPIRAGLDEKSIQTIQLRVCNVLVKWIESSFNDIDEECSKMLSHMIHTVFPPELGKRLSKTLENQVTQSQIY